MGNMLHEVFDSQDAIMDSITSLFTHTISKQENQGDYLSFNIPPGHNVTSGGVIHIFGVVDKEGKAIDEYNSEFEVYSVTATSVVVKKSQPVFGNSVTYDEDAVFSNAYLTNVRVHNDPFNDFDITEFPIVLVDVDDTMIHQGSSRDFIPAETLFPISVIHRIDRFDEGATTRLKMCRYFIAYKMQLILDNIKIKLCANVSRMEDVFSGMEVSMIGTTVKK